MVPLYSASASSALVVPSMIAPAGAPPGCCAIVDAEYPAKIDANETTSITWVGFLMGDTPYGAVKLRTLARTLVRRDSLDVSQIREMVDVF